MDYFIPKTHPLNSYHRKLANFAGRSDRDIYRQWGKASVKTSFPPEGCEAGSYQTVVITFRVGDLGLDENGGLRLSFRHVSDMGALQTQGSKADNYVRARTSGIADLEIVYEPKGNLRPFQPSLLITVRNATLMEGDEVEIILGDTTRGSRGWRQQTYGETPFPVRFSVDPLGTHDYHELPKDIGWNILPGSVNRYVINTPSHAVKSEAFPVRVKAEDSWGNPLRDLSKQRPQLLLVKEGDAKPFEVEGTHNRGVWSYVVRIEEEGNYFFSTAESEDSLSNPIAIRATSTKLPTYRYNWCDLHGQSGETVGAGTVQGYFDFAHHFGFLDGSVHQGNDFQIGLDLWETIKAAANTAYEPGKFVTFQGYEWSGTMAMGGDHNVLYHEDDPPIYRSSGWLDGNPFEETAPLGELYQALRSHNAMTIAHIGGRPASLEESDPQVEHLMEIHSAWGTFEWVYEEAFEKGFKIGFVCNSDGHKCRPGASYPGAGIFGTLGGLTCILAKTRDRDGFWEAMQSRRCYGTTGQRIIVETDMNGQPVGADIQTDKATVKAKVLGTAPLSRIDLFRKSDIIQTYQPKGEGPYDTLILRLGGARVKGRARMVKWKGRLSIEDNTFEAAYMNGIFSPTYGIQSANNREINFKCVTTGNLVNFVVQFKRGLKGTLNFDSNVTRFSLDLGNLSQEPQTLYEEPLDQRVEASACAKANLSTVAETSFYFEVDHDHEVPYFLRVTQLDEGKAWTSPFYVARS